MAGSATPIPGVVRWDDSSVSVFGEQPARGYVYRPFSNGAAAFSPTRRSSDPRTP